VGVVRIMNVIRMVENGPVCSFGRWKPNRNWSRIKLQAKELISKICMVDKEPFIFSAARVCIATHHSTKTRIL